MSDAYIISPLRTPIGRYGGGLAGVRIDDMIAQILKQVVERSGIPADRIDDVIIGCANQAGEDNRNLARMGVLLAGLPETTPATTLNRLCGSALDATIYAARAIKSGEADIIVAGGAEVMSRAPYVIPKNATGQPLFGNLTAYDTALGWRFPNPAMEKMFPLESMGETAENIAERWEIGREEQDAFALRSHQLSVKAWDEGKYDSTVVPVEIPQRKGDPIVVARDEGPRANTSLEKLSSLKPVFRKGGSVTPGNSSSLNDGAGALVVASEKAVKEYGLKPILRYVSGATAGVDPCIMGIGPVPATKKALERAALTMDEVDLIELNEAFAVQSLAVIRELGIDTDKLNVNGGAIALGHPLGMSGVRLIATLGDEMARRELRYGLATMCIGVGQGVSGIFERVG
ncbi:MAG: acetyl-CoA C-acyltransferase [Ignavibacteriae bacterium]|nr:acetyl-CoA C-acyltransferase [Ignavibacteriota bacterium]MCB9217099.1 acetyl-CoA C-acyltransferase [Ignavibacteria bacterium]